jgi:hypothetical protein
MLDITTLAAWGEFIGGIAVVVSLIYLASQIRQNSKLLRASTASATIAAFNDTSGLMAQDSEVARIFWDGMSDRSSLPEADRRRFDPLAGMLFNQWNQEYQFFADGVLGAAVWEHRTRAMRRLLRQSGISQHWREYREDYPDEFGGFVDALIREGEAAG